jgi:hypothetical protein
MKRIVILAAFILPLSATAGMAQGVYGQPAQSNRYGSTSNPPQAPNTFSPYQGLYNVLNYGNTPQPQPQQTYRMPTAIPPNNPAVTP